MSYVDRKSVSNPERTTNIEGTENKLPTRFGLSQKRKKFKQE